MALNFMEIPQQGGGWFKPDKEMTEHAAFLVEVNDFTPQRPTDYGPKDSALVDLTIFHTEESLDAGEPDEIIKGTRIEQTVLARDLKPLVGGATIVTLAQVPPKKPGGYPAWVWRQTSASIKKKVIAYAEAREAAVEDAVADAPDFD